MAFNSAEYAVFYLAVLVLSWALARRLGLRAGMLLLASYWFYASNNHGLIVLILVSTQIDYVAARAVAASADPAVRRRWLVLSVVSNLGILGYFKYTGFFTRSAIDAGRWLGLDLGWVPWEVALPVGISFYTFQSMSYTIDVYRGAIEAERSWLRFSLFVAYFPQLVAGPIVRPAELLPQLDRPPRLDVAGLERALLLIVSGLVKKIVLGDYLARSVDAVFSDPAAAGGLAAWLAVYAFALQIYFDFSGYSDIAIGCAKLMGFDLPENFHRPYVATSLSDFWRRWHVTLSTWLRDYLYVPLGGNRTATRLGTERNLMLTMLLGGLWHGAAWNFVLWGALHGTFLVVERRLGLRDGAPRAGGVRLAARRFVVFQLVCLAWIVFRAETVGQIGAMLSALARPFAGGVPTRGMALAALFVAGGLAAQVLGERRSLEERVLALPVTVRSLGYGLCLAAVAVFGSVEATPFIYFQF